MKRIFTLKMFEFSINKVESTPESDCEERSHEGIRQIQVKNEMDCFAALAMTPF